VRIRAVVFDLFITLTDWEAERCRPQFMDELAVALGADPLVFSSLMRATFTERVSGDLGDARSTFSTLDAERAHIYGSPGIGVGDFRLPQP